MDTVIEWFVGVYYGFVTHIALVVHLFPDHRSLIRQFPPMRCHGERLGDDELLKVALWAQFRVPASPAVEKVRQLLEGAGRAGG